MKKLHIMDQIINHRFQTALLVVIHYEQESPSNVFCWHKFPRALHRLTQHRGILVKDLLRISPSRLKPHR